MEKYIFKARDAKGNEYEFEQKEIDGGILLTLKKENIKALSNIRALGEFTAASAGDAGFYVIPRNIRQRGDILTEFKEREDCSFCQAAPIMSFFGFKRESLCCLVRVERSYDVSFKASVKGGRYSLEAIFDLENDYADPETLSAPEDINIEIYFLGADADHNSVARKEREIRLARGEIKPLSEKCKREAVEYARKYPHIRIRQGWKQSPSPLMHQSPDKEPPMYVACTFKRVRELADELKRQGVDGAELQLVGWNIGGHDGRFPQLLPPDPRLGGEKELKETAEYLKSLGYRISLHTNLLDAYEIADTFNWDEIAMDKTGAHRLGGHYSGGRAYYVCPKCQYEIAKRDYPEIKKRFDENGMHFTDVMSIALPYACHNARHPFTFKDGVRITKENIDYQRELFGAFSSEGCLDYTVGEIDYGLYISFGDGFGYHACPVADKYIRLWEVAYHGTVLYNPESPTVNYPIKTPEARLRFIMSGGKPSLYFYSRFRTGGQANWMGEDDLTCDGEEDMKRSVECVKTAYEEYKPLRDLQLVYMNGYDVLDGGIEVASYADGTRVVGNFSEETRKFEGKEIKPFGYAVIRKA